MEAEPKKDVTVVVRLPRATVRRVDRLADDSFENRSTAIRRAIDAGLARLEELEK